MKKKRKIGVLTLSSVLAAGVLAPAVSAESPGQNQPEQQIQIRVAQTELEVSKSELVKRFKELLPDEFDSISENEFDFYTGFYPEDETMRYNLSVYKETKGKVLHADISFYGESLEVENFSYQPSNLDDAGFPAKVSKDEAQKIAEDFLKKFTSSTEYKLNNQYNNYYYPDTPVLTEPIRYEFSFVRTKNNIPIYDQTINIVVLGNGEVNQLYRYLNGNNNVTFDNAANVLKKEDILSKVKENLFIKLQYEVDFDYKTRKGIAKLVYAPSTNVHGVNALTGEWVSSIGNTSEIPKENSIKMITETKLAPRQPNMSIETAKTFAEGFLKASSDKYKIKIESINEIESSNGQQIISVNYMYDFENGGGYGGSLDLDKQTGDVIQFYDMRKEVLREIGGDFSNTNPIGKEAALNQAVNFLKQYSPSILHNYSLPLVEANYDEYQGTYNFSFPRVVDGIPVMGDSIYVSVFGDGTLQHLSVNNQNVENWPSKNDIISLEEAKKKFEANLDLELRYERTSMSDDNHYSLIYAPLFNESIYSFIDATTGEWNRAGQGGGKQQAVTHPWAEEELNYLIENGILNIKDVKDFNADASITKGKAIEVIMKSLLPYLGEYYSASETEKQSFENIGPDHPLYEVIEEAIAVGILDKDEKTFDVDGALTREELAVWYVRGLGFEKAAENGKIYRLNFKDANKVEAKNVGYVAIADSLGILTDYNKRFNPDEKVTYAQLAVSVFKFAKEKSDR